MLVRQKDGLDYHLSLQMLLRGWLFIHIPLTYSLMIFSVMQHRASSTLSPGCPVKDQLPSPRSRFQLGITSGSTQVNWICGKAAEGQTCRIGPDGSGRCRAELRMRPHAGSQARRDKRPLQMHPPCRIRRPLRKNGPLPNVQGGRAIVRCQPVRSLRSRRKVFTWSVVTLTLALLLIVLGGEKISWKSRSVPANFLPSIQAPVSPTLLPGCTPTPPRVMPVAPPVTSVPAPLRTAAIRN